MSPIFVICAIAFFAQAVYSQGLCGGSYPVPISSGCGVQNIGIGNLGYGGLSGLSSSYNNVLNIASSSPAYNGYPSGVAIASENEIGGQVAVSGAVPFVASSYFGGNVPSQGEASVSYSAGPAGLNGGGCGYGWSGSSGSLGLGSSCGCGY